MKNIFVSAILVFSLLLSSLFIVGNGTAHASDEYDTLRLRWFDMLTGGSSINTSDPDIAAKITIITNNAQTIWDSMDKTVGRTTLWADLNSTTDSSNISLSYSRLAAMALAYSTVGSTLQGNVILRNDLVAALDWMYTNRYNETKTKYNNWFDWEIGAPQQLNNLTVLLYDQLTSTQITNYMNAIEQFSSNPLLTNGTTSTGANRVWKAHVVALRGIIVKSSAKITSGTTALSASPSVFAYVTSGTGFYTDGSFIQHSGHPYNGGYGLSLLVYIANHLYMVNGSTWMVSSTTAQNLYKQVYEAFEPLIYNGAFMDMVRGREMSRYNRQTYAAGHLAMMGIVRLAYTAPATDALAYKRMVKQWLASDTNSIDLFYEDVPIETVVAVKSIMNDSAITPRGELVKHFTYARMDRAVHLRPGFGFGLSMYSNRSYNYESINSENKKGWYTSQGMTYLYNSDADQYSDQYWATVNSYRLPGTTVDTRSRTASNGETQFSTKNMVGGTNIAGQYGVSGMELADYGTTLTAKKSWFMFDDEIVALGAGITSTDNRTIETIVDNRKLTTAGINALTVNGTAKSPALGWTESMTGVNTIHLQGNVSGSDVGYYFPGGAAVKGLREARTGSWSSINSKDNYYNATNYTRNFMTLWFDHGSNPTNSNYAYVLLPNKTSAQTSSYAANSDVDILANTAEVHAVKEKQLNITGANFWSNVSTTVYAGGQPYVTSSNMASVLVQEAGNELTVAVADPSQVNAGSIVIDLNQSAAQIVSKDSQITVVQMSPTIKLSVNVNGAKGRTFTIKLNKQILVQPAADAYTDGCNADSNYGSSSVLIVKGSGNSCLSRKTYLKFELSSLSSPVFNAKLKIYGSNTTDNVATAVKAYEASSDTWTETGISWNNAPGHAATAASTVNVNSTEASFELDVTSMVNSALSGDKVITIVLENTSNQNKYVRFFSREAVGYPTPYLVIQP
ncbi:polysaccharide lyase family 8 super-sandwich domain-containing protein [Paenibacillus sp. FSL H7-0331]|uniref:polysaccharide lyase family 8 super-sandwich domain-containing protein n=1 Tax=Paenibacillus sp. FSL H7-0331 TaxID=1920421 RepID=UPI00096C37C8|nr:polysaccharide lyase family 8 super-sandwich domain-containing protein [Paenibacillus sp. FSL H7-0331]OME98767.1 hypothetical protein BK127_39560 [Paenibacillus sp. FSL H7-0331]